MEIAASNVAIRDCPLFFNSVVIPFNMAIFKQQLQTYSLNPRPYGHILLCIRGLETRQLQKVATLSYMSCQCEAIIERTPTLH